MSKPFEHGEYVWTVRFGEAEMVMVEEVMDRGQVAVRFINSETMITVAARALDREHPKARAASFVRHAAGR
jgi:hypothetical protein